jgi:hypothetical protein
MLDALMNLIPFALSLETNMLVDVADVPSGKKCGCICPSCKIPLIAKKGDVLEWHFAHDSQFIEKDQELSCDFSWTIAVKMMIKQLLLEGTTLALPEYYIDFQGIGYQKAKRQIKVTDSSIIHYENPELKSLECDVTVEVKGKKLGIILLTNHSHSLVEASFNQALFGVIAISIENIGYNDEGKAVNHLRNQLRVLIESKTITKHWLYHGRGKAAFIKATEQDKLLSEKIASITANEQEKWLREKPRNESKKEHDITPKQTVMLIKKQWYCVSCKFEYHGYSTGLNSCPQCNSHLYRTPK